LVTDALVRLPVLTRRHLRAYLFAVVGETPDRAWTALQQELTAATDAQSVDEVQRTFRKLVPFRDDRFTETGSAIADLVLLQWRTATRSGWLPSPHIVPFYRAFFAVASAGSDREGDNDAVAEAINSLRFEADLRDLGDWVGQANVVTALER